MCMVDDCGELAIVLHERHRTARKPHRYKECGRSIQAGEQYLVERVVWDGHASTHKTCSHCQVVREWLLSECGGFVYCGLFEDITEHSWEGYGVGVKMLAVGMERQWTKRDGTPWRKPSVPKVSGHAH